MQSTGQTSTQELSFWPMQGSVITYAMGREDYCVRRGDHLEDPQEAGREAGARPGHRPEPDPARAVPDATISGPDLRQEPEVRPRRLVAVDRRRGRGAVQPA